MKRIFALPFAESGFVPADIYRAAERIIGYSCVALLCLAAAAVLIVKIIRSRKKKK